jgi:DNA-directed RNA polymerase specialized sigma24 family protein
MVAERNLSLLQDHVLADSARRGGVAAFEELFRRHGASAWGLAVAVTRQADAAERAVVSAFAAAFGGTSPALPAGRSARPRLLAAVRHAAVSVDDRTDAGSATGALHLDSTAPSIALVRRAFAAVPERLRSVLWLVDVQGLSLDEAAEVLEVAPSAVAALADRARLGIHEQILHDGLRPPSPIGCRRASELLDAYVSESLDTAKERKVRRHLDGCEGCRERLSALDDVVPALRNVVLPLPLTLMDAARERWSTSIVRDKGPLGLALPGREPVPVWAQRALAGAVGAVVALGITGATILAGRGGRNGTESTRQATAESSLGGDGESALGSGLDDLVLDGSGFVSPSFGGGGSAAGGSSGSDVARSGDPLPFTSGSSTLGGSSLPKPTGPSGAPSTGSTPPPTTPPTTTPPVAPPAPTGQVTVGVSGVATVTVGQDCTGANVLGTVVGCEPTTSTSDSPVTLDAGGTSAPLSSATTSITSGASSLTSSLGL